MDILTAARQAFSVYKAAALSAHDAAVNDTLIEQARLPKPAGWAGRFFDHCDDKRGRERLIRYEISTVLRTFSDEYVSARNGHCVFSAAMAGNGNVIKDMWWSRNMGAEADCHGKAELYGDAANEMFNYYIQFETRTGGELTFMFTCHRETLVRIWRHYRK